MKHLRDTLVIARRELLERVKSKWFVVMTVLGPVFMVAMIVIPAMIGSSGAAGARVEIVDRSGVMATPLHAAMTALQWKPVIVAPETPDQTELDRIRDNDINGFIVVPADALDGGRIVYRGDNASSQMVQAQLREIVRLTFAQERGRRAGIARDKLDTVLQPPSFTAELSNGETKGSSGIGAFLLSYILAFILYMVITLYGVAVMRSVVQEKTSRVMELLVAAVKPRSLMGGKILGVGGAGLIQVAVWLTMGAITLAYSGEILAAFGVSGPAPSLPALEILEVTIVLIYFVLGFFFYSAMYAAVGAMVSSEQETQQVQMPVTMLLVIGVLCFQVISNDPRGSAASVMTMVPFWSPLLMPMRFVLGGATVTEVAISLVILVISTGLIVLVAAKIYRVGVLMYGKRPSLRELVRWLRY